MWGKRASASGLTVRESRLAAAGAIDESASGEKSLSMMGAADDERLQQQQD